MGLREESMVSQTNVYTGQNVPEETLLLEKIPLWLLATKKIFEACSLPPSPNPKEEFEHIRKD